jgi:outer membrane protein assembly factor BamB
MRRASILVVSIAALADAAMSFAASSTREGVEAGWATYNRDYGGQRYSPLTQLDTKTAGTLKRVCSAGLGDDGTFQSGPVVVNDTLYVTTGHTTVALGAASCELRWRHVCQPEQEGVTPTAGGITLAGDLQGNFLVFDSDTGTVLFKQKLAGGIGGGIVTYGVKGKQYIALTPGNISRATFKGEGTPEVVIYGLGLAADDAKLVTIGERKMGWEQSAGSGAAGSAGGKAIYTRNCAVCHGTAGEGGVGPSLLGAKDRLGFDTVVDRIRNPLPKMPKLPLQDAEIKDVSEFVQTLK